MAQLDRSTEAPLSGHRWVVGSAQPIGAGDVEDLLVRIAVLDPALDDLETLERGAGRVAQRAHRERGTATSIGVEFAAHGDAALVAHRRHVVAAVKIVGQAVAGEHLHPDASSRGSEGTPSRTSAGTEALLTGSKSCTPTLPVCFFSSN